MYKIYIAGQSRPFAEERYKKTAYETVQFLIHRVREPHKIRVEKTKSHYQKEVT